LRPARGGRYQQQSKRAYGRDDVTSCKHGRLSQRFVSRGIVA
jgi:hypothetical protein